jgi:hypothetical protein
MTTFKLLLNLRKQFLFSLKMLFLSSILLFSSKTFGQIGSGVAPVNSPSGGFNIDGTLQVNSAIGDWLSGPGGGGNVLDAAGVPLIPGTTFHLIDPYNANGVDDGFNGGLKFNDNPNSWTWGVSPVNNKQDINNALVHFSKSADKHLWVMVAADRLFTKGDAYIDFEFLQNTLTVNSDGTFTSLGPDGGRTVNDFLLTLELTNGGTSANFYVHRWEETSPGVFDYMDESTAIPMSSTFAAVNQNNGTPVSFGAFGNTTYTQNAFAEAAIDLTALIGNFSPCTELGIKSLFIKTKESQAPAATIVDFISPSLPVSITIGVADAGKDQSKCSEGTETIFDLTGTAIPPPNDAVVSTIWTFVDGTGSIDNGTTLTPTVHVTSASATLRLTVTTENATCNPAVHDDVVLTVKSPTSHTTTAEACDSYTWAAPLGDGQTYTASGTPTNVTTNAAGCNHTETLDLTIKQSTSHTTTAEACDSYTWAAPLGDEQTYTASGTHTNVTTNAAGCTHTETLDLTIKQSTSHTTTVSVCDSYTWAASPGDGQTYTASGRHTNVSTNAAGCSHTETLELTIKQSTSHTTTVSVCDSYKWAAALGDGQTYTASGTHTNITTNAAGCTHTETLDLTIKQSTSHTTTVAACDSYTWAAPLGDGQTFTASGTHTNITTNAAGCTHTETLDLTIKTTPAAPILTIVDYCGSSTITAKDGNGILIPAGELTWSNGGSVNQITVLTTTAVTAKRTVNGCLSVASNSVTPVGGTCSHIFPTQTTCCNYEYGPTNVFQFKQVCITPTYSTKGNTVGNAIPGVFFYYGDYTAPTTPIGSSSKTIVITQTYTPTTILAPFNAKSVNYVHVTDNKCNNIALTSVTYDRIGGVATVVFKATAGTKYVISVKYDTKSIITTKLPNGKPLSGSVATYTFGMSAGNTLASVAAVPGSTGTITATVGCSDNTPVPTGTCPTTTLSLNRSSSATMQDEIPSKLRVSAYPNPFTDKVKFSIESPVSGKASLVIYNIMGQKLHTVYQGYLFAGRGQVIDYNVPSIYKGSLIYTLKVGDRQVTGKVIQIK